MQKRAARVSLIACVAMFAAVTPIIAVLGEGSVTVAHAQVPEDECDVPVPPPVICEEEPPASESASASATSSASTSTSPSPTTSPSGSAACPSPGSSSSACPSRSASSTSPPPSRSASASGSPTQQARTISLFASKSKVTYGETVDFAGQIFSGGSPCSGKDEFVRLQRRLAGSEAFADFKSTLTDADGRFEFNGVVIERNADYVAVAPSHDDCATAESSTVRVLARGRVSIKANDKTPARGSRVRITGSVKPSSRNSKVRLQQRRGGGWETVLGDRLDSRSRYLFEFVATGPKTQRYRVHWLGSRDAEPGTSRELTLKLHK